MARLARRYPVTAYFLLAFAISWSGFVLGVGPRALVSANWQAERRFLPAVLAMLAGPSVASLLLTGLVAGRAGYRDLWSRLCLWRVGFRWYALAILPAPIVCAGILWVLSMPLPLLVGDVGAVFVGGLGAGLTTLLEEIGWTGFAVPRLRRRHGVPTTGLIVGVLWGLWHLLQQVFISGTYRGDVSPPAFMAFAILAAVASLTAYRILMVWLFDRTGSLLVTTLMHGMLTASSIFWFTSVATGRWFLANVWLVAVAMWMLVGAVAVLNGWLKPRPRTLPSRYTSTARSRDGSARQGRVSD
jgi:uncharacterized protein